jgi:transposase
MPRGRFGPRAQAIVGYLSGRLGASHRDVSEVLAVLHGLELSLGSVAAIERQVSAALAQPVATAQAYVQQQVGGYVDETSWRQQSQTCWLWLTATAGVTAFQLLAGRGAAEARQVISQTQAGVVATDRYTAYNWLAHSRRQICWAHLKRDFAAIQERGRDSGPIGQGLLAQVEKLFRLWRRGRDGARARVEFERQVKPIRRRVRRLLQAGTESTHHKTRHTCANILQLEAALWTFARVAGVEPTNNNAARPLRRAVLWRRKSFGTQSAAGSRFVERILTAVTTLRQQGRAVLDYLTQVCAAAGQANPSDICLLPAPS